MICINLSEQVKNYLKKPDNDIETSKKYHYFKAKTMHQFLF